jgi:hypothetical protein
MWFIIAPILATIITLTGTWWLSEENESKHKLAGWWLHIVGTALWITYSITLNQVGMAFACAAYLIPEIRGIIRCLKTKEQ